MGRRWRQRLLPRSLRSIFWTVSDLCFLPGLGRPKRSRCSVPLGDRRARPGRRGGDTGVLSCVSAFWCWAGLRWRGRANSAAWCCGRWGPVGRSAPASTMARAGTPAVPPPQSGTGGSPQRWRGRPGWSACWWRGRNSSATRARAPAVEGSGLMTHAGGRSAADEWRTATTETPAGSSRALSTVDPRSSRGRFAADVGSVRGQSGVDLVFV